MNKLIKIIPMKNSNNFNYEFFDESTKRTFFSSEATREQLMRFIKENPDNPEEISYAEEIVENQSEVYYG
jgi:hypothetical protein